MSIALLRFTVCHSLAATGDCFNAAWFLAFFASEFVRVSFNCARVQPKLRGFVTPGNIVCKFQEIGRDSMYVCLRLHWLTLTCSPTCAVTSCLHHFLEAACCVEHHGDAGVSFCLKCFFLRRSRATVLVEKVKLRQDHTDALSCLCEPPHLVHSRDCSVMEAVCSDFVGRIL